MHFIYILLLTFFTCPCSTFFKGLTPCDGSLNFVSTRDTLSMSGDTQQQPTRAPAFPWFLRDSNTARSMISKALLFISILETTRASSALAASTAASTTTAIDTLTPTTTVKDGELSSSLKEVIKQPSDTREYKALTLDNGLRVLLISDPSSSRAAAAMDVHVGAMSDTVPGLAHFCEHMSFLGTRKFPQEDAYNLFLSSHGGGSNAYTDSEDTVYYFDINSEYLGDTLDRFSQFFISPLFTESATSRELNAIESEHAKNINNDGFRLYQLEKDGSNPLHPLHKFFTGNKDTLQRDTQRQGIDIRKELLSFHDKYYSANQMTLCITGAQDISTLEAWTRKYFTPIVNKQVSDPALQWWGKVMPYLPQKSASLLEVVPIGETRRLTISWPLWVRSAQERDELQYQKPEYVVSHLIGHEGKGSIRSLLAQKGWANGVGAAVSLDVSDLQMFEVSIDLTEEGMKHRDDIVEIVFAYINLLKALPDGIPDYVAEECSLQSQVSFNYSEKAEITDYTSRIASDMQVYKDPSVYLIGSRILPKTSKELVANYLNRLHPQDARLKVISHDFEGKTKQTANIYGTKFNNITQLESATRRWASAKTSLYPQLAIPAPNLLMPHNFDIIKPTKPSNPQDALHAPPQLILNSTRWSLWHKLDQSFTQPKIYAIVTFAVADSAYDAAFVVNSKLFSNCFLDSINEYLYDARLAGLGVELEFTSRGVQLVFSGYNDKMPLFVKQVVQYLRNFDASKDIKLYNRYKDLVRREFLNWRTQQPYSHCSYYAALALENKQYPIDDLLDAIDKTNVQALTNLMGKSLSRSYGTALVMGNVDEAGAKELLSVIDETFPFEPLSQSERSYRRPILLPLTDGSSENKMPYRISRPEPNTNDDNSCATYYFELSSKEFKDTTSLEILSEALEQSFYNSLRTQQQLGYIVYSGLRSKEGTLFLTFTVQSSIINADEISDKINEFIQDLALSQVENLTQDVFDDYRNGIIVRKLEPDQQLSSQAGRFWSEIIKLPQELPLFNRHDLEVEVLRSLKLSEFKNFAKEILSKNGKNRRLLISQVTASNRWDDQVLQRKNPSGGKEGGKDGGKEGGSISSVQKYQEILPGQEVEFMKSQQML